MSRMSASDRSFPRLRVYHLRQACTVSYSSTLKCSYFCCTKNGLAAITAFSDGVAMSGNAILQS